MSTPRDLTANRPIRLGTILVRRGLLDEPDVERVLEAQHTSGQPFGLLCEKLFGLDPQLIESAWAQQYASLVETVDPEVTPPTADALREVSRRQAWQFRVLPLAWEGRELRVATTPRNLCRALRFASKVIHTPVHFVMTSELGLERALTRYYAIPGITAVPPRITQNP